MHMVGTTIKIDFQVAAVVLLLITSPVPGMLASLKNEVRQDLEVLCFVLEWSWAACPHRSLKKKQLNWDGCGKGASTELAAVPSLTHWNQKTEGHSLEALMDRSSLVQKNRSSALKRQETFGTCSRPEPKACWMAVLIPLFEHSNQWWVESQVATMWDPV